MMSSANLLPNKLYLQFKKLARHLEIREGGDKLEEKVRRFGVHQIAP